MRGRVLCQMTRDGPSSVTDSYYKGMVVRLRSRTSWVFFIAGIIAMGILSRVVHTGLAAFDKYLGDTLYATMVYGIMRLLSEAAASAVCAMVAMTAIELFQLTMISGPHAFE